MTTRINQRRQDDAIKALKAALREQERSGASFEELNNALLFSLGNRLGNVCPHCVRIMAFELMDMADVNNSRSEAGHA